MKRERSWCEPSCPGKREHDFEDRLFGRSIFNRGILTYLGNLFRHDAACRQLK